MRRVERNYPSVSIAMAVSLGTALLCFAPHTSRYDGYKVGEIMDRNFKAPFSAKIIDDEATRRLQSNAADQVPLVYDFDSQLLAGAETTVKQVLLARDRQRWTEVIRGPLTDAQWKIVQRYATTSDARQLIQDYFLALDEMWIVEDSSRPQKDRVAFRDVVSGEEVILSRRDYESRLMTSSAVEEILVRRAPQSRDSLPETAERLLARLVARAVGTNLSYNKVETDARMEEAVARVEPRFVDVSDGEIIVREGQRIEPRHLAILKTFEESTKRSTHLGGTLLFALFFMALLFTFHWVGRRNFRKFRLTLKDQAVMGGLFLISLSIIFGIQGLLHRAENDTLLGDILPLLIPLGFAGMTLRLFTSMELTIFFVLLLSSCLSLVLQDPYLGFVALAANLVGAARMRRISERMDLIKAGLLVGVVQAAMMIFGLMLGLVELEAFSNLLFKIPALVGVSLGAGLISAGFVLAIQPLLEYVGYTTDLRLMELSNTNHPLLREMILKAPGTYFHSFTVSQLAEKAAEAINGNPLFARVASLYHDIGKTKKPHYFIENIKGENKHDKLVPTMSALIIANHVRDGIEMGQQFKLPNSIIEVIPQHHGTALISYFYDKALKLAEKNEHPEELNERDFRYPGPKPQTREAAIIMLADAVEATAKALPSKGPDEMKRAIHSTIQRFFLDGQLDECDLSLKDLNLIGNAFLQVLQGVYHQRIEYPHLKAQISKQQALEDLPVQNLGKPS